MAWQGGEPTLMKVEFFRHAVEFVEKFRKKPGQVVKHTFSDQRHSARRRMVRILQAIQLSRRAER